MDNMNSFGSVSNKSTKKARAAFGIDLGTTNSAISVVAHGSNADVIRLNSGKRTMPSCVIWENGKFIVGDYAYNNRYKSNAVYSVKRLMEDLHATLDLEDKETGKTTIVTPASVSAEILKGLIAQAGDMYGDIKDVVVTVPSYFNQNGLTATRQACKEAGLNLLSISREPTAAVLCYKDTEVKNNKEVIVFDLGGGTFDVSIVRIIGTETKKETSDLASIYGIDFEDNEDENDKKVTVIHIDGDTKLGGDDVDLDMYKIACEKVDVQGYATNLILEEDRERIILELDNFKKTHQDAIYEYNFKARTEDGLYINTMIFLENKDFFSAFVPTFLRCKKILDRAIRESRTTARDIILVGGSTKSSFLQQLLKESYPEFRINNSLNPDESVANGAGLKAYADKFDNKAVQVFDVIPLGIGIREGSNISYLVKKDTQLPVVANKVFTTVVDNQSLVSIEVFQGNSRLADECAFLGTLHLDDIKPAKAGEPDVLVKIVISADGLMTCTSSVDGVTKEIKLDISSGNPVTKKLTSEEKLISKWTAHGQKLTGDAKKNFLEKLEEFKLGTVEKADMMNLVRSTADLTVDSDKLFKTVSME